MNRRVRRWIVRAALVWALASCQQAFAICNPTIEYFLTFKFIIPLILPEQTGFRVYDGENHLLFEVKRHQFLFWIWWDAAGGPGQHVSLTQEQYGKLLIECLGQQNSLADWEHFQAFLNQAADVPGAAFTASRAMDIADLNGDDRTDVVGINTQGAINVRLANDAIRLRPPVRYNTGPGAAAVRLADLNGDGLSDAVVANQGNFVSDTGKISVLLGNADGTFRAAVHFTAGVAPTSLAIGDFNGDGKLDVAAANRGSLNLLPANTGDISILLGNGDGTLRAATRVAAGNVPVSILAADLNKDGKLDLAVVNYDSGTVSLLNGNGDGTFQAAVNTDVGAVPSYLGAADLNGDGRFDLVILHTRTSTLSAWSGQAEGRFQLIGRYLTGSSVASFDFSLSETDRRPTIHVPYPIGDKIQLIGVNLNGTLVAPRAYPAGADSSSIVAADFTGDRRPDVIISDRQRVLLLPGRGEAQLDAARAIPVANAVSASAIATADFNADGRPDLAVVTTGVVILLGNGDGTFQTGATVAATTPSHVVAADFNGDGRLDLATVTGPVSGNGTVTVFLGNGNGTFQTGANYPAGPSASRLVAGDFNGDGRADLVVVNGGVVTQTRGGIGLYLANANGTLAPPINIDAGEGPAYAAVADFNGDGLLDLAFSGIAASAPNYIFRVTVLPGNGNGTFQAPLHHVTDLESGFLLALDLDRDGRQDLMMASCCGNTDLMLLRGNGDGTFRESHGPGGQEPSMIAAADFNDDGRPDLAVLSLASRMPHSVVSILPNDRQAMEVVSAASSALGGVLARDSIVSAYGSRLANATAGAPSPQWPATLAGTTVRVRDAKGVERQAQIAFASSGQVNFLMPADVEPGYATVTITSGSGVVTSAQVAVRRASPGVFAAGGTLLAAALLVRVRANGEQVVEQVVQLNAAGQLVAAPIDMGEESDQLILLLFGTGIRNRNDLSLVKATVGGIEATVNYAGPQGEYPGLDQVNVLLPRSLRGRGLVDIVLTVEGSDANIVKVQVR